MFSLHSTMGDAFPTGIHFQSDSKTTYPLSHYSVGRPSTMASEEAEARHGISTDWIGHFFSRPFNQRPLFLLMEPITANTYQDCTATATEEIQGQHWCLFYNCSISERNARKHRGELTFYRPSQFSFPDQRTVVAKFSQPYSLTVVWKIAQVPCCIAPELKYESLLVNFKDSRYLDVLELPAGNRVDLPAICDERTLALTQVIIDNDDYSVGNLSK